MPSWNSGVQHSGANSWANPVTFYRFSPGAKEGIRSSWNETLTSVQGCNTPPKHIPPNSDAWPFARHWRDRASFLPRLLGSLASRHTGALEEAGGEERHGRTLSPLQALGDKSPALITPSEPAQQLLVFCWRPSSPGTGAGCRASPKLTRRTQRCHEHPRLYRPRREAITESFQHTPVCFYFLISNRTQTRVIELYGNEHYSMAPACSLDTLLQELDTKELHSCLIQGRLWLCQQEQWDCQELRLSQPV